MKLLKPLVATSLSIFFLAWFLPTVDFGNWMTLVLASIVLTLLQKIVRPILKILFLPINIVTLGLFSIIINVSLLWLATYLVPGFHIQAMTIFGLKLNQFFSLLLVSVLISFLQNFIGGIL